MKKLTILLGAAAATAALWGAGTAGAAPDVVGDTYSDASTAIEQAGGTSVVATRVGSGADEGECIVTNAWDASFVREGESANGEVMVALNCNSQVASAGESGNSAASPAGREAKAAADEAASAEKSSSKRSTHPAHSRSPADHDAYRTTGSGSPCQPLNCAH